MNKVENSTLELPLSPVGVISKILVEFIGSIDVSSLKMKFMDNRHSLHPLCEHTGYCGSKYHNGNNYCHVCSICNPSNPDSY